MKVTSGSSTVVTEGMAVALAVGCGQTDTRPGRVSERVATQPESVETDKVTSYMPGTV